MIIKPSLEKYTAEVAVGAGPRELAGLAGGLEGPHERSRAGRVARDRPGRRQLRRHALRHRRRPYRVPVATITFARDADVTVQKMCGIIATL